MMKLRTAICSAFVLSTALAPGFELVEVPELGLRVASGFEVSRYADHALAPDLYSMTLDPKGRVVVSSKGFIKRLLDTDGDGRADKDELIAKSKAGAMGMLFLDETTLLTTEGGALNRYTDADGDGKIDPEPQKIAQFGGGEHGAHAMRRAADGSVYLIGGNDAKFRGHEIVRATHRDLISAGALLRFDPELREAVLVSHGFRNPYDFDIDSNGEVYCYDSDCEREVFLPWYSPTRLYRIEIGAHHGWRLGGWKRGWKLPDYHSVKPLVNVGRGSPTGVAVYRHGAFPTRFEDGVFYADWTFGKIYFTQPNDALMEFVEPQAEVFIESTGTNGFAPTDIVVAPDGALFVSMGGRGTSGSVFQVRAKAMRKAAKAEPAGAAAFDPDQWRGKLGATDIDDESGKGGQIAVRLEKAMFDETWGTRLELMRELMVALGDWNLREPSKELFTGYELAESWVFEDAHLELLTLARNTPRALLLSALDPDEKREAARLLAMLRDPHPITATRLLDAIDKVSGPVDDFHYLTCLARVEAPMDQKLTGRAAAAILALDGKHAGAQLRSKQTYTDRLNELIASLAGRSAIYAALLEHADFAKPGHAGIAKAFPKESRERVAQAFARAIATASDAGWRADAIEVLAPLPLRETRPLLRKLAAKPMLALASAKLLARDPEEVDRALMLLTGRLAGLEKLPAMADAENLLPLFRAADGERALKLIARAAAKDFANRAEAEVWLRGERPQVAAALGLGEGRRKAINWPERIAAVDWGQGDAARGAIVFAQRACATCHASDNALGPALAGVAQRLSAADLFKAITEPNADVPEAYRSTVFTLVNGATQVGRVAFSSADGVILQTAAGTVRIDEGDIAGRDEWARSLMPEGLLDGLSDGELADLRAYLAALR